MMVLPDYYLNRIENDEDLDDSQSGNVVGSPRNYSDSESERTIRRRAIWSSLLKTIPNRNLIPEPALIVGTTTVMGGQLTLELQERGFFRTTMGRVIEY
ncbi:unnamed protein product [Nippostrongylus brasiliensis]|uniref:Rad21_Rec8 domain-containing protein n=1 Tax=Nippostrongylus brasiliensis TaxID=27835 RepID=A0A0N4YAI0_NIPBR|nr:unnamed protein product [Nippostrongylus brasiliensis]